MVSAMVAAVLLALLGVAIPYIMSFPAGFSANDKQGTIGLIVSLAAGGFTIAGVAICFLRNTLLAKNEAGILHGTLARSVIPVYAAAILIVGSLLHPYFEKLEPQLLKQDPILYLDREHPIDTNREEAKITQALRSKIQGAVDKAAAPQK